MSSTTVGINALNIRYREEGEGKLLLLLHGWGANIDLFAQIFDFTASSYRVCAFDMPGFGKSDEPAEPFSLDDYVDFVADFLKKVYPDEKEVILLGHSHGGRVILRMLSRMWDGEVFSFTVPKVILTDSAGIRRERTKEQEERTKRYKTYKKIIEKSGIAKLDPKAIDRLQKKFGSADYAAASPVMRASMVKVVNEDLSDQLPKIKTPALLIWGSADTDTPLSDGKKMEELMPEAGLAVIEGAGHYSFLEQPVWYNRILGSFLGI